MKPIGEIINLVGSLKSEIFGTGNPARRCRLYFKILSANSNILTFLWCKKAVKMDLFDVQVGISTQRTHGESDLWACVCIDNKNVKMTRKVNKNPDIWTII